MLYPGIIVVISAALLASVIAANRHRRLYSGRASRGNPFQQIPSGKLLHLLHK